MTNPANAASREARVRPVKMGDTVQLFVAGLGQTIGLLPAEAAQLATDLAALVDEAASQPREAGDDVTLAEAARDLVDARERLGPAVFERRDLWERLALILHDTAPTDQAQRGGEVERLHSLAKANNDLARMNGGHRDEWRAHAVRMTDALQSIREHCGVQPSALAKAIVATCDAALAQSGKGVE